jgi:hypothetical protein
VGFTGFVPAETAMSVHAVHPLRAALIGLLLFAAVCDVASADDADLAAPAGSGLLPPDLPLSFRNLGGSETLAAEVLAVRSRIDVPSSALATADGRPVTDLAGVSYRWWLSRGRTDWGLGVGTLGYVLPAPDGRSDAPRTLAGSVPTLTVGMRYWVSNESALYADASGARGLGAESNSRYVNAKVGVEWKPARSRFGLEQGSLGVHFDSGYHLTVRTRHGGLGVYLRNRW